MNDISTNIENKIKVGSDNETAKEVIKNDTVTIDIETNSAEYKKNKDENEEPNSENVEIVNINMARNDGRNVGKQNLTGFLGHNPANVTWVQYQWGGGAMPPSGGAALDYDPRTRNQFVMQVMILVFIMLLCTLVFNIIVFTSPSLKETFLKIGFLLAIPAMIIMIALNYAIACSPCTRHAPCSFICLILAVVGMSVICAFITVRYDTQIVLYAMVATAAVVFVCILLACSSFDFTQWLLYVIVIAVAFSAIALIASLAMVLTGTYMSLMHLIILVGGTLLNVMILTIELQTILGGRAVELSEDDYALGAFLLYTSIVDIFLKLVQILGILDDW